MAALTDEALDRRVQQDHEDVLADALAREGTEKFVRYSRRCVDGHWRRFQTKAAQFSRPVAGGVFLDFGCKFGHLTPLLFALGVSQVLAVDVDHEHVEQGAKFFGPRFDIRFSLSDECYVDIASQSVDFVLVNEVISHINPRYLETFYAEVTRVLRPGGEIVIADGNNLAHEKTHMDLIDWYGPWDGGESKEFGPRNYARTRAALIGRRFPDLDPGTLEHLARNTAGLHGERLLATVERFVAGGPFVERPHRPGVSPTHPVYGVVMERGFYPSAVEASLRQYGVDATQIIGGAPIASGTVRGRSKNFTVRGVKLDETVDAMKGLAQRTIQGYGLAG